MAADGHPSADMTRFLSGVEPRGIPSQSHQQRSSSNDSEILPKPKRRKHLSHPQDEASKHQMFYFVDSNSSSREKRAHVMRHHVQEKRKQRKHPHIRSDSEKKANRPLRYLPWQQKSDTPEDLIDNDDASYPTSFSDGAMSPSSVSLQSKNVEPPSAQVTAPEFLFPPSPLTILDASRNDPFDSLPLTSFKGDEMQLADYWLNKLSYWSGQNKLVKEKVFNHAKSNPLSFQAVILAYCARWKAQIFNETSSPAVNHYLKRATESLDAAANGSRDVDGDQLAMALAGMALQEDRFGSKQEAMTYSDRAVDIIRPQSRSGSPVEVFLHYVRYTMIPPPSPIGEDGQQWLVTFLRLAEGLMLTHNTEDYLASVPQRRTAFQMEGPLFPLLSSGPRPSQVPHDSRMYVVHVPTQEVTRTAALIYITYTLWDFQNSPGKTNRFLTHIHKIVKDHKFDRYPACETFIWLLLEENCDVDLKDPDRGWRTGELLRKHKQLRPDLQFQFNETLFSFLMLTEPLRGVESFEKELCPTLVEEESDY